MSQGYAVDFYGVATYGFSQPLDYSVEPFNATQNGYNSLTLSWKSPNATPWKLMQLTSSLYGYPSSPADGTLRQSFTPAVTVTSFDDFNLLPGRIYYYTMFLALESPTWNSGTTYAINTVVLLNGMYWKSLQNSNVGNTPAVGSAFWANTQYAPIWFPAGYAASLVVTNNGYSQLLYNRTPQPYKITASDIFTNTVVDNPALLHYLSIFGFHLDMLKTEYDLYLQGNNPDVVGASNLDWLGGELGITTDYLASPQSRRNRIKNAAANYRLKGTEQGIHNAIAAVSGWDSSIAYSSNLMLNGDQSTFMHPLYDQWNASITYFTNQLVQFNGFNYKCLTQAFGTAQAPTGTSSANTWWSPQISTTTTPITDTTVLKNPMSFDSTYGGFSTWSASFPVNTNYTSNSILTGVITGLPHPTNANIKNWNALGFKLNSAPTGSNVGNYSINAPAVTVWSNGTNYVTGNYVSTNAGANLWMAVKASGPGTPYGFITPGSNETFWTPFYNPANLNLIKNINWAQDAIPVRDVRQWDSKTTYATGTQVQYFGIIYQAVINNINNPPSGYYYHNSNWIYIRPSEYDFTLSAYESRITTNTTTVTSLTDMTFLDNTLTPSVFYPSLSPTFDTTSYLSRFIADYADLNGVNDNTLSSLSRPWVATAGLWKSNYGMASVNQSVAGSNTYSTLRVVDGRADINLALTFVTDYADPVHYGHGILFRYQDATNFWYATRQTLYLVSAGTETVQATYPRLNNGDRMWISLLGTTITIQKYTRDGSGSRTSVTQITSATLQSASIHGLIQKFSPTGAV